MIPLHTNNVPRAQWLLVIFLAAAISVPGHADTPADTVKTGRLNVIPAPVVTYSPETHWAGGVVAGWVYHFAGVERASSSGMSVIYSERKQFAAACDPSVYVGSWHFTLESEWLKWPDDSWGLGPNSRDQQIESYTARVFRTETGASRELWPSIWVGAHYKFETVKLLDLEPNGWLASIDRSGGRASGRTSGAGFGISYDTRDHIFFPVSGVNGEANATFFDSHLGSQYEYSEYSLNVRRYFPLHGSHVFALQGYGRFLSGTPNFRDYSSFAADDKLRGYNSNRYRDKHAIFAQAEYRFPIWWRFRGALFTGAGDVAPDLASFVPRKFKHVIGAGLRFVVIPREKLSVRCDVGYGANSDGFYLAVTEAF